MNTYIPSSSAIRCSSRNDQFKIDYCKWDHPKPSTSIIPVSLPNLKTIKGRCASACPKLVSPLVLVDAAVTRRLSRADHCSSSSCILHSIMHHTSDLNFEPLSLSLAETHIQFDIHYCCFIVLRDQALWRHVILNQAVKRAVTPA